MNKPLLLLFVVPLSAFSLQRGNGDRVDSFPSFYERQLLVLTDACRMAPTQYRDRYIGNYQVLLPQNYPAVKPLYWNLALNKSSRAQAIDMANNCGLQHNSCDGTSFATRVESFYLNKSYSIGENIATGYSTALTTFKQWVLEVDPSSTPVPADLSGSDGHRQNIMRATYQEMGCGYSYGPQQWKYFWVQDFGGGKPDFSDPLVSGSHFFITTDSITFFVNYADSLVSPANMVCTIDGASYPMTLAMGIANRGTYTLTQKKGGANRHYFFSCSRSGAAWRYPEYGVLLTAGEGAGTNDYIPPESLAVIAISIPASARSSALRFEFRAGAGIVITGLRSEDRVAGIEILDVKGRVLVAQQFKAGEMKNPSSDVMTIPFRTRLRQCLLIGLLKSADGREQSGTFFVR